MESVVKIRNEVNRFLYENIVKRIAFSFEPEEAHHFFVDVGKVLGKFRLTKKITRDLFYYANRMLEQNICGIKFRNPVGLSAGFDKDAEIISIIDDVGFGFTEVGSVTKLASEGNTGKRLERLKKRKSLWVNFGLNNKGADEITQRLKRKRYGIPIGISIAKTNCKETADDIVGRDDYIYSLKKFNSLAIGDYYVLNISCPNAYGGQPFSRAAAYRSLLKESDKLHIKKPVFVKLSPDLSKRELDAILRISKQHRISGFIISNLTKKHEKDKGGVSGKIVEAKANRMLKYVYQQTKGRYVLIGVGGIFSAEDAYKKIKLGASLVELITGMIYQGPGVISEINQGLVELLKRDGFSNISEAIGIDNS